MVSKPQSILTPAEPPTKTAVRLVAIDLDGTLLNDSKQVSDQTLAALRCLPGNGIKTVIASARPPRSVRPFYRALGLETLQINYNGALIWDEPQNRPAFHCPLHPRLVCEMIEIARDMFDEVLVSCEIMDKWFTDRAEQPYTTETGKLFKPDLVAPLETFCTQPVTKLMLLGDPKLVLRLEDLLLPRFGDRAAILRCDPELLQIMDIRASKSIALQLVARHYGIAMQQVMSIGDALNDIGMLECSGVAVAMDNAPAEVKAMSDWVAPSNNDHGVHAALLRYGLCE